MDKETAMRLLAACRPEDRNDPAFEEALRELESDAELAAWFKESQRFDAVMTGKLHAIPVPADLKDRLLTRSNAIPFWRVRWIAPVAAALLIAGFLAWRALPVPPSRALALQAISYTEEMPALQFVCFNASEVASWVNDQPGAKKLGLRLTDPGKAFSMKMIGSSIVDWNGTPVVMLCLQNGRQMAMLYILNGDASIPEGVTETIRSRGWTARTIKSGGQLRVLATKGEAGGQDFLMPF